MIKENNLSNRIGHIINYALLVLLCLLMLYPFWYYLVISLNDGLDTMRGGVYFWPREFTLNNYLIAFQNGDILNALFISVTRTILFSIIAVALRSSVGYALSRKRLWGRTAITFYFYFVTLISGGMVPTYILYRQLGLLNNYLIYILPGLFTFFDMVMFRTYFSGMPDALEEAAAIDGCGAFGTFVKIYMPLAKPVYACMLLFAAVTAWNDWFTGMYYVTDSSLQPAATLLQKLISEVDVSNMAAEHLNEVMNNSMSSYTPEALRAAFLIILTVPILIVYPFAQKYFVGGVMVGAVKD